MRQVPLSRLNFLCHSLNILCRCLNFLCCCFTGVFIAESDVGVGTIVGSAVFNILFIVGVCGLFAGMVSFLFGEKKSIHLSTLIYYNKRYHSCEIYIMQLFCTEIGKKIMQNSYISHHSLKNKSQNANHFLLVKIPR